MRKKPCQKLTPERLAKLKQAVNSPNYLDGAIFELAARMAVGIQKREKEKVSNE